MLRSVVNNACRQTSLLAAVGSRHSESIISAAPPPPILQQIRTTFILKRRKKVELVKAHKHVESRKKKSRHFIYDLVEDTNVKPKESIKVILKEPIDGLGSRGEIVTVQAHKARSQLLLPGLAVYASPENTKKYEHLYQEEPEKDQASSVYVTKTIQELSYRVVSISMNLDNPWTLEPWHVRVAFRRIGIIVPESSLTLPPHTISGPDLSLQNKEFIVRVKINNKEEAPVRCKIHHFASNSRNRLPWVAFHWQYPGQALFPEDAPLLEELALNNKITRSAVEDEL